MERDQQGGDAPPREGRETRVGPSPGALQAAREAEERARREAEEREQRLRQPAAPVPAQYQPHPTYPAYGQPPQQQAPPGYGQQQAPPGYGQQAPHQQQPSQPGQQQPQPADQQPPQHAGEQEPDEHPEQHPPPPYNQQPSYPAYGQPQYPGYPQQPYGYGQPGWGQTPYGYAPVPYGYGQPPAAPQPITQRQQMKAAPAEHPKELPWQLAGWWSRVGAQLIDLLIVWVPLLVVLFVLILLAEGARNGSGAETTWVVIAIVTTFAAWAVHLFYAPLLMKREGDRNGQTWGKQICNIRVIRADGEPMKFADAALRQIIFKSFGMLVASTLVPVFPWILNYLWPTWDEQHRALHDLAADTRVVVA